MGVTGKGERKIAGRRLEHDVGLMAEQQPEHARAAIEAFEHARQVGAPAPRVVHPADLDETLAAPDQCALVLEDPDAARRQIRRVGLAHEGCLAVAMVVVATHGEHAERGAQPAELRQQLVAAGGPAGEVAADED